MVSSEADIGLLGAIGANQSVDLEHISFVELLDGMLDHILVSSHVDLKNEGICALDLLSGNLRVNVGDDGLVSIQPGVVGNGSLGIGGFTGKRKSLGTMEGSRGVKLGLFLAVHALGGSLLGSESLLLFSSSHFQLRAWERFDLEYFECVSLGYYRAELPVPYYHLPAHSAPWLVKSSAAE